MTDMYLSILLDGRAVPVASDWHRKILQMFRSLVLVSVVTVSLGLVVPDVFGWQYTYRFPWYKWCRRHKDKFCDVINFKNMTGWSGPMYCGNGQCAGVEYADIQKMYRGIFFDQYEIDVMQKVYISRLIRNDNRRSNGDIYSDWDKCCSTKHMFVQMPEYLLNKDGENRTIVHFPEKSQYQAAHIGTCDTTLMECDECRQIKKLVMLLVIDPNPTCWPPLMYDVFEVDGYCSCTDLGS